MQGRDDVGHHKVRGARLNMPSVDNSLLVGQTDDGTVNDFLTALLVSWCTTYKNVCTVRLESEICGTQNLDLIKHDLFISGSTNFASCHLVYCGWASSVCM